MSTEVFEKWGFGLAPPKEDTQQTRLKAAFTVQTILNQDLQSMSPDVDLEHFSIVKGMFNRIVHQDQWDWFTVMGQLGYPSSGISKVIARKLSDLRSAFRDNNLEEGLASWIDLRHLPTRKCLDVFRGKLIIPDEADTGWVYILSTREIPDLLKIGMTTRSVEERVQEINRATGVVIPFGVRSCWRVKQPANAERLLHQEFQDQRIRNDREFFRIKFFQAHFRISEMLASANLEIRTLKNLSALS
jgi:T5orf172 domain